MAREKKKQFFEPNEKRFSVFMNVPCFYYSCYLEPIVHIVEIKRIQWIQFMLKIANHENHMNTCQTLQ